MKNNLGDENGVLITGEPGFNKKDDDAAGVYCQYSSDTGEVDNVDNQVD